jgi:hypothetical protein
VTRRTVFVLAFPAFLALSIAACQNKGKVSLEHARAHADELAKIVREDVEEVRRGLPDGAKHLAKLYESERAPKDDLPEVRAALERARGKVQDLRVAKSTFFALVDPSGQVLRNDQEQDLMVGKKIFSSFPELEKALSGKYVETRGSMPEAARVKGPDGQWVAAQPIVSGGATKGLYVTGWSWSAYAYRLENAVRSGVRGKSDRDPLIYVYVVVDADVYGAPISPEVNAKAIAEQKPMSKIQGEGVHEATLEITGRDFGLAVKGTPALGPAVGVAVLRSET